MRPLRLVTISAVFSAVLACVLLLPSPGPVQGYHWDSTITIEPPAPREGDFVRIVYEGTYYLWSKQCGPFAESQSYSISGQTITIRLVWSEGGGGGNQCTADSGELPFVFRFDVGPLAAGYYTVDTVEVYHYLYDDSYFSDDPYTEASFTVAPAPSPDADGDGFSDVAESGMPLCAQNNDDDSDGVANDGCPGGPAQAGSFSEAQFNIGTNPLGGCGAGVEAGPSASWPLDFVSGGYPDSTDKVTITDVTSFLAPVRRLDTSSGEPNFSSRWDLVPGNGMIFPGMINVTDLTAMFAGSTGSPPMLGGARALNGPSCTGA